MRCCILYSTINKIRFKNKDTEALASEKNIFQRNYCSRLYSPRPFRKNTTSKLSVFFAIIVPFSGEICNKGWRAYYYYYYYYILVVRKWFHGKRQMPTPPLENRRNIIGFIFKNNKSRPRAKVSESCKEEKPSRDDGYGNGN